MSAPRGVAADEAAIDRVLGDAVDLAVLRGDRAGQLVAAWLRRCIGQPQDVYSVPLAVALMLTEDPVA